MATPEHVRIVVTSTTASDQTISVRLYVNDECIETYYDNHANDTLSNALSFLQGYMTRCPHDYLCSPHDECKSKPIPFTFSFERQWQE